MICLLAEYNKGDPRKEQTELEENYSRVLKRTPEDGQAAQVCGLLEGVSLRSFATTKAEILAA